MDMFKKYIKKQWGKILFYLLFSSVFFCLFFMYQIPLHAAFYAVCVGGVFGIAVLIFQFTKFRQKYIQLERAVNQKEFLLENLPKAEGGLEAEYEKIVERLYENIQNMENVYNEKELDMLEYYTCLLYTSQAQSLNLYITNNYTLRQLFDLYVEAGEAGVKTIYYIRSKSLEVEECESCAS